MQVSIYSVITLFITSISFDMLNSMITTTAVSTADGYDTSDSSTLAKSAATPLGVASGLQDVSAMP
jgi:hypothetical protein